MRKLLLVVGVLLAFGVHPGHTAGLITQGVILPCFSPNQCAGLGFELRGASSVLIEHGNGDRRVRETYFLQRGTLIVVCSHTWIPDGPVREPKPEDFDTGCMLAP